jgi:hypothetical protein
LALNSEMAISCKNIPPKLQYYTMVSSNGQTVLLL